MYILTSVIILYGVARNFFLNFSSIPLLDKYITITLTSLTIIIYGLINIKN